MKVRRTLFALTVASLALWPGLAAAQALLSAPELVLPRTRFEITLSGFDRDSRTLADTPPRSSVTQKEERVSAALEFGLGPLFLGGLMFGVGITISLPAPAGVSPGTLLALGVISQVFILGTVGGAIYWLNQVAVRRRLEPLREELVRSLVSLSE